MPFFELIVERSRSAAKFRDLIYQREYIYALKPECDN
jgi:hypothetical protein